MPSSDMPQSGRSKYTQSSLIQLCSGAAWRMPARQTAQAQEASRKHAAPLNPCAIIIASGDGAGLHSSKRSLKLHEGECGSASIAAEPVSAMCLREATGDKPEGAAGIPPAAPRPTKQYPAAPRPTKQHPAAPRPLFICDTPTAVSLLPALHTLPRPSRSPRRA